MLLMTSFIRRQLATAFGIVIGIALFAGNSQAQFSQTVVVMKGTILTDDAGRTVDVKLSVRAAGDTASEITASRANSATGKYLVVLKPGKKYWIHLEGAKILSKDTLIEVPNADHSTQIVRDFTVTPTEVEAMGGLTNEPAKK